MEKYWYLKMFQISPGILLHWFTTYSCSSSYIHTNTSMKLCTKSEQTPERFWKIIPASRIDHNRPQGRENKIRKYPGLFLEKLYVIPAFLCYAKVPQRKPAVSHTRSRNASRNFNIVHHGIIRIHIMCLSNVFFVELSGTGMEIRGRHVYILPESTNCEAYHAL